MALKAIDVKSLPVTRLTAGKPTVTLNEHGQASFSAACVEAFEGCDNVQPMWDGDKRILAWKGVSTPGTKQVMKLARPKIGKSCIVSSAGLLQYLEYDYRTAGSQRYDAKVDAGKGLVAITLPAETPTPRVKVERKKKPVAVAPEAATEVAEDSASEADIEI